MVVDASLFAFPFSPIIAQPSRRLGATVEGYGARAKEIGRQQRTAVEGAGDGGVPPGWGGRE